jgi:hypothetical protein
MQTFPLKLCDVGLWVRWVLNELEEFDQVSSASLPSVLTKEVQMRVKAYQRRNSLEVDGLVGPATWRKMFGRGQCYDGDYGGNGDGVCGPGDNPPD